MNLSGQQLSLLLDEVAAMARAERSLVIGLAELGHRSLGRIGKAAAVISQRMQRGQSAEQAFAFVAGKFGSQAEAALRTLTTTGSTEPVSRLAEMLRAQSDLRSQLRIALLYPSIAALIVYLFLALGVTSIAIETSKLESFGIERSSWLYAISVWWRKFFWVPPLIFLVAVVFARYSKVGAGASRRLFRSKEYSAWATFCDFVSLQLMADVPHGEAIKTAARASGDQHVIRLIESASFREGSDLLDQSIPPMIRWLLKRADRYSPAETSQELRVLGQWYRQEAWRRAQFWIHWVPLLITAGAGVLTLVTYTVFVLQPLVKGMREVAG